MPVSVVVGGQFGSEGKGKTALEIVRSDRTVAAAIRVGGTNSGHTALSSTGRRYALRQLPAASVDRSVRVILPPGSYIDIDIFRAEVHRLELGPDQVAVSPMARIITNEHKSWERDANLASTIGSTESGTGAAVMAMTARGSAKLSLRSVQAEDVPELQGYLKDTGAEVRALLDAGKRVVVEGTQGFGLSPLQGGFWPKATSRDTTAAAFLAEAGLSPLDVDDVTLVIRCHPIRVAGDSGPLPGQTSWEEIAAEAGIKEDIREFTTVTTRLRRVGRFDPEIVRRAIQANQPTRIVLNHLDYVDPKVCERSLTAKARAFIKMVEDKICRPVDWLGIGPGQMMEREPAAVLA
jgi:adenylosuccinate synthase